MFKTVRPYNSLHLVGTLPLGRAGGWGPVFIKIELIHTLPTLNIVNSGGVKRLFV